MQRVGLWCYSFWHGLELIQQRRTRSLKCGCRGTSGRYGHNTCHRSWKWSHICQSVHGCQIIDRVKKGRHKLHTLATDVHSAHCVNNDWRVFLCLLNSTEMCCVLNYLSNSTVKIYSTSKERYDMLVFSALTRLPGQLRPQTSRKQTFCLAGVLKPRRLDG